MSGQYEITQADARTAVQAFDQNAADIKSVMNRGYSECQAALSTYKGAQAEMFWQILGQIQVEMQNISKELDVQGQLVHSASATYTGGDEEVASLYRGVGGSIASALG
ncbi:MAG: WXG100 family type VII secretion target [Kineosporiaceae bacterium]